MAKHIDLNLRLTFNEEVNFTHEELHEVMRNLATAMIAQVDAGPGIAPVEHPAITRTGLIWHDETKLWTSFSVTPVDIHQGQKFAGDPGDPDHRYVARDRGGKCPFCGGSDIRSQDRPDPDGCGATCKVKCENCGKSWQEIWRLAGICDNDFRDFKPEETQ